jgi:mono/diheme cytochrome c family protein
VAGLQTHEPDFSTEIIPVLTKAGCNSGACHGAALNGTGEAPALVGGEFVSHWDTMTLGDLYDRVRTTMPQNDPQSLTREDYADVLAFLLKNNGFPAGGQPLDRRSEVLATIGITAEKPANSGS